MKILLKLGLSLGILYWLISAGKIDFSLLHRIFQHPANLIGATLLLLFQVLIWSYRWRILLKIKSPQFPLKKAASIQWIGLFFSSVLPGAVAGDLIKIGYALSFDRNLSKKFLFFTIFFDRVIGLSALLFVSGVTSLFFYKDLEALNPNFKNIIFFNTILFLGSILFLGLFFIKKSIQEKVIELFTLPKLKSFLTSLWGISNHKKEVFSVFAISLLSHILSIFSFWLINEHFFETTVTIKDLLTLIPIGQIAVAIPISPGGLGVGHMAYEKLFQFIHQANGASLFNLFWMVSFFINLLGVFPYILLKSHANEKK